MYLLVGLDVELDYLFVGYDEVELDENGEINVFELIEDELILVILIVFIYNEILCSYLLEFVSFGKLVVKDDKLNLFDILK